jgi:hypothetical protein
MTLINRVLKHIDKIVLLLILLLGGTLRFYGVNWDQGTHLHPDERAIIMAVERLHWPQTPAEKSAIFTHESTLNPKFFAYGNFPFYMLKILGNIFGIYEPRFAHYDLINILGRVVSGAFELGTIWMVYRIGRRMGSLRLALWGAFLYSISVLPIQLAHFFAVDTILTFFIVSAIHSAIAFAQDNKIKWVIGMGLYLGLAMASKISAVILLLPISFILVGKLWRIPFTLLKRIIVVGIMAGIIFIVSEPFAILDFSLFKRQMLEQQAMTKSAFTFPYTLQYVGKIPYWHEFKNIFLWGLGPIQAGICILGTIWLSVSSIKKKQLGIFAMLAFLWIYFGVVGKFAIGFIRYLLPIYPILALGGAYLLDKINIKHKKNKYLVVGLGILFLVWPFSFISIYSEPNSRTTASAWIYANIPVGSKIGQEHWDDGIPVGGPNHYEYMELPMYEPDSMPAKWQKINKVLDEADYIIIGSNRLYVPLMKMTNCSKLPPDRCYTKTAEYYRKLFAEELDFKKIAEFWVLPKIPFTNIQINDFSADETFTVYDHTRIMIFKRF